MRGLKSDAVPLVEPTGFLGSDIHLYNFYTVEFLSLFYILLYLDLYNEMIHR